MTAIEVEEALWGLYHSIYYCPDAAELFSNLPRSVINAFAKVQTVTKNIPEFGPEVYPTDQFEEINAMAPYESG